MSGEKPLPIRPDPVKPRPALRPPPGTGPGRPPQPGGIGDDLKASDLYSPDVSKSTYSTGTSGSVTADPVIVTLGGVDARLPGRGIMAGSLPGGADRGSQGGARSARCYGTSEISGRYRELGVRASVPYVLSAAES